MAFAITQSCCTDASCLSVCPVNCIHPTPDETDFGTTDQLHVDPRTCIDCGACADACPVDAVGPVSLLPPGKAVYAGINARYYDDKPVNPVWDRPRFPPTGLDRVAGLRVAIVGTGPAACYTAQALLRTADVRVTMIERLPTPGGLARFGVAPDHLETRRIAAHFAQVFDHPRVTLRLGTEVGHTVSAAALAASHDAVIWAVGADADRTLGVPGEDLPGSASARTVVGWYTGHPHVSPDAVDLDGVERVVLIGNGNVALDVARVLTADPDRLADTDIAPHALAALRRHRVREVVIAARRGPEHAAFTRSEALGLRRVPGLAVVVERGPATAGLDELPDGAAAGALRDAPHTPVDLTARAPAGRRVVLSFGLTPSAVRAGAEGRVAAVELTRADGGTTQVRAELLVAAVGYRGARVPAVPFDETRATVRNDAGRVLDDAGEHLGGHYVVGWAARGSTGGIGDNRGEAEATVRLLLADVARQNHGPRRDGPRRRPLTDLLRGR